MLRAQKALLPDPTENYQQQLEALSREDRRERTAAIRNLDKDFPERARRLRRRGPFRLQLSALFQPSPSTHRGAGS
jgi:hypothetical protein